MTIAMGAGAWLARPTPLPKITAIHPLLWESGRSVKTDGTRVYQIVTRGGRSTLQQVPISGGDPVETPLPFPGEVTLLSAIPGESSLLVAGSPEELTPEETAEGWPVWRLSLPVGVPERLGDLVAHEMDVSPDGKSLALIRGGVLVLASIDGSDPRELLRLEHGINGLRWSPDGRRLRYTSVGPRENQGRWIWEIPVAGGPPRPLWPGHWGAWTGDGEHYVFDRPPAHDLYFATESPWARWWPGPPRPLTSGRGSFRLYGGSTNGDRLIVSGGLTPRGRGTLLQYDPKRKVFEPAIGGESAFYAEPSPDGEWLAWVRPEGTLWRSRPDGSERLQLTRTPSRAFLPRWSPDGTRIVYVNKPDPSSRNEIRVVAADGSAGELIARSEFPSEEYWDACWLPDDSIIMSHLNRRGLFRYDPSSRRVAPEPGGARHWFPKCSRQGDVLAALAQGALQVRRRGTTEWRDLGVRLSYPNWTRDGRSVCGLTLQHRVVCFDLAADRATVIVDASGVGLARSGDAWMGLDAEDRPLVLADDGQAYVYALHWEAP